MNKLSLLVVEDIKAKQRKITGLLHAKKLDRHYAITFAGSLTAAKVLISSKVFDVLLLDQHLPEWDNDTPVKDCGLRILRDLSYTERNKCPCEIIVLSSFELATSPHDSVSDYGCHCITYSETSGAWKKQLVTRLEQIHYLADSGRLCHRNLADIAIITALEEPEFDPYRDAYFKKAGQLRPGEDRIICEALHTVSGETLRLVGVPIRDMGLVAACEATLNLIYRYRPKLIIMSGIAGRVSPSLEMCDLVVADQSWNYDAGKWIEKQKGVIKHLPEPRPIAIHDGLRTICEEFSRDKELLLELRALADKLSPKRPVRTRPMKIFVGPVVSGSAVVESQTVVRRAGAVNRKTLALEMEIFGVYHACKKAFGPKPLFVAVKGISDKARSGGKTDKFHRPAAQMSALFVRRLLETKWREIFKLLG